jgi:mono/diheme cytochrome c family protein
MEKRRLIIYTFTMLFILMSLIVFVAHKRRRTMDVSTPYTSDRNASDLSNGAAIYNTGEDINGKMIPIGGGPSWIILDGGGCSVCHGENGKGKKEVRDLKISPPNIKKVIDKGNGLSDEDFEKLLKWGVVANDGRTLSWEMPRFAILSSDLRDLRKYIEGL